MKPGYQDDMQRMVAKGIIARPVGRGVILEIPCTGGHTAEHPLYVGHAIKPEPWRG